MVRAYWLTIEWESFFKSTRNSNSCALLCYNLLLVLVTGVSMAYRVFYRAHDLMQCQGGAVGRGLGYQVPAVSKWQKAFSKLLTLTLLSLSNQGLSLEALCTTIILWACSRSTTALYILGKC